MVSLEEVAIFMEKLFTRRINILGTEYTIQIKDKDADPFLNQCDGYCDKTTHKIVIAAEDDNNELGNYEVYQKKILRHEIIHAFLFESGLRENFKRDEYGHDETMVDWVAVQFPKMLAVFTEIGCL